MGATSKVKSQSFVWDILKNFSFLPRPVPDGHLAFTCNICGTRTSADLGSILDRELPTCHACDSSIRFRSLMAALLERLFHEVRPLNQLQERKDLQGVGMSDEEVYSSLLEKKFAYINTFFHAEPYLDIRNPPSAFRHRFDFLISAEVMEHVPPPIDLAFKNLRSLLRPSGLLVFSAPFTSEKETLEHFPDLHQFEIVGRGNERCLINMTPNGEKQVFRNLVFHGGKGATLEMRVFSQAGVLKLLEDSGFRDIRLHSESLPEWGIVQPHPFSVPITALAA